MLEVKRTPSEPMGLEHDTFRQQVQKALQSATFRNAANLQQLLQYLTNKALDGSTEPLKEYTIGVEAFGRPVNFDPKTDTIVRVQIHRLRQKLREYYDTDGRDDPILIDIPKGHYLPRFESVVSPQSGPGSVLDSGNEEELQAAPAGRQRWPVLRHRRVVWAATLSASFALGLLVAGVSLHWLAQSADSGRQTPAAGVVSDPVKSFWVGLLGNDRSPIIGFPDAQFLLDSSNDLFSFPHGASDDRGAPVDAHLAHQFASNPELVVKAGPLYYENGYTGAGELQAIAQLANLFGRMGIEPIVKPGRDITPSDLRDHNIILLGSTFQNVAVTQMIATGDFVFESPDLRANPQHKQEAWRGRILNIAPQGRESAFYRTERDPEKGSLSADYSLISIQSDESTGHHIAVLGGLDTMGTLGAVTYATSRQGVEELTRGLASLASPGGKKEIPAFQALLRNRLERGSRVRDTSLLAIHRLPAAGAHAALSSAPSH